MRKYHAVLASIALLFAQVSFADDAATSGYGDPDETSSKPCEVIAKACEDANYVRSGEPGKAFWRDCMKPIVLGKTVTGVSVDSKDVRACRTDKIAQMKKKLKEFEAAQSSHGLSQ